MLVFFLTAAAMEAASSGVDVPTPTIAAPMTKSETLNLLATATDPVTREFAPSTIPASETIRIMYSILFYEFVDFGSFVLINS